MENGTNGNGKTNGNGGRAYFEAVALWCLLIWMIVMGGMVTHNITRTLDLVNVNIDLMTQAMVKISLELKRP